MKRVTNTFNWYIVAGIVSLVLLLLSNLYLLRPGFWYFQDAAYWPKNSYEALIILSKEFHVINTFGNYLGFDQGLFSYASVEYAAFIYILFQIFGYYNSQIAFSIIGYCIVFISFFAFSGIFFKDKKVRFIISLFYTFDPLSYTQQGAVIYKAAIPLFLYSFYHYYFIKRGTSYYYLLLNCLAVFLWIAYIRFFESDALLILPYTIFFFIHHSFPFHKKKIIIYLVTYFCLLTPVLYSVFAQFTEHSQTAFNYGTIFNNFFNIVPFYSVFSFFHTFNINLYTNVWWTLLGICFFIYLLILVGFYSVKKTRSYYLHFALLLFGITLYGMANIFGQSIYAVLIRVFPFLVNGADFAYFVIEIPLILLLATITEHYRKHLYIYCSLFIVLAILPLLNLKDFQLQKFPLQNIPTAYRNYFVSNYTGIPDATLFYIDSCWRAKYMEKANIPTICNLNIGEHYSPIVLTDPRLSSGNALTSSELISSTTNVDNLKFLDNLKYIIVPNDIVVKNGPGPITTPETLQQIKQAKTNFNKNNLLSLTPNKNFNIYSFKDKQLYDYLLYSPSKVVYRNNLQSIIDNSLISLHSLAVVHKSTIPSKIQSVHISYKIAPLDPSIYYFHVSDIKNDVPFLLQFNQLFNTNWKIYWITKNDYTTVKCSSTLGQYSESNNDNCEYNESFISLRQSYLIGQKAVMEKNHFIGNYINNMWIFSPTSSKDLYGIIIFQKQIYYSFFVFISCITFAFLLFLAGAEIIQNIFKKYEKNN